MRSFSLKAVMVCVALLGCQATLTAQAATKPQAAKQAAAQEKVSALGGKLAFTLPEGFMKGEMPEIDEKAIAQGVTGSLYTHQVQKRVLIVTETPVPMGVKASDNDTQVLDGLIAGTLAQQSGSYKDFQRLAEKRIVKKNGLGIRQLDTSATMSTTKVLSTTIVAASGTRATVLNVVSPAKDPAGHAALVKTVIGE